MTRPDERSSAIYWHALDAGTDWNRFWLPLPSAEQEVPSYYAMVEEGSVDEAPRAEISRLEVAAARRVLEARLAAS